MTEHICKSDPQTATQPASPDASLEDVLVFLAESDIEKFRSLFKRGREVSPDKVTRACLRHLAEFGLDAAGQHVLIWVAYNANYLPFLLDNDFMPLDKAERVAAILRDADPRFSWKFHLLSSDPALTYLQFLRALNVFELAADRGIFASWLRGFANHANTHIRSKAVKRLCEVVPKVATVGKQLESTDARVRANAIEALWSIDSPDAVFIFRESLSDSSHRVVVNALVGLYRRNIEGTFEQLVALSESRSAMVRCAAAWGMGEIVDPRGIPVLKKLAEDRAKAVRFRALHSLSLFPA